MQIRLLKDHSEYHAVERLQKQVWQFEDREIIPVNELITAQNNGGLVCGAFEKGTMVGFCFGLAGYKEGRSYHCSRMLAIHPQYQNSGLGYRLKLFQRNFVLKQGLDLIQWTFDPLQSRNAYFNIEKLGVIVRAYTVNLYGESSSRFNRGLETDRFVPEWWIRSKRVLSKIKKDGLKRACSTSRRGPAFVNKTLALKSGFRASREPDLNLRDVNIAVEIPSEVDRLKTKDVKLAQEWRVVTREIFIHYFKRGYVVTGFCTDIDYHGRRSFYLLEKGVKIS